ncbi:MAG: prefoldin subunit beta [Candidatus Aenigmarchaeota archaeon]|nr:prefoldin subunit beta [Candidatus Aenigmarchaeota archaeon]
MAIEMTPDAQKYLMELQTIQAQLQNIAIQKETFTIQNIEIEKALEELAKTDDNEDVFKAVGPILIKTNKADMVKELKEKQETAEVRLKSLEKQEAEFQGKIQAGQQKLQELLMPKQEEKKEEKKEENN